MNRFKNYTIGLMVVGLLTSLWGCVEPNATAMGTAVAEAGSKERVVVSEKAANPYEQKIVQLTTTDCARCHESVFNTVRDTGGKHQLECRFCHETFHTYRPDKAWKDEVPNCETCHGEIHGAEFKACLSCHGNAHAPIAGLVNMTTLEKDCGNCHAPQQAEITEYPSAHGKIQCSDCHHSRHGYVPNCTECHAEPHTAFIDNSSCMGCHPVHKPKQISYSEETPNSACAGCHSSITTRLETTHKKHAALQCSYCHTKTHGNVPNCQQCHGLPHSKAMLDQFNGCLECHGDPHALVFPGQ